MMALCVVLVLLVAGCGPDRYRDCKRAVEDLCKADRRHCFHVNGASTKEGLVYRCVMEKK